MSYHTKSTPVIYSILLLMVFMQVRPTAMGQSFPVVTAAVKASIVYSKDGPALDSIAANLLADDIKRVTTYRPAVLTDLSKAKGVVIVIGGIQSNLVQRLIGKETSLYKKLSGQWECFGFQVIERPANGVTKALIIAGSDRRGTAYGVFSLSEKMGVSPWWWWADVPVRQQKELVITQPEFVSAPPSVKYRGIFINDEDWGLQPWAAKTFEPETRDIGPKTYAKVFELLLRLKANLIWPAMHPSTKAFYHYPLNKKVADDYAIVVGSSHAEPMLRNNVDEWNEKTMGYFNYLTNKEGVQKYWEDRVRDIGTQEVIYTVGMRGVHDSQMEGVKSAKEAVPVLERVIQDQRELLKKYQGKDVTAIPQAFTAYKEVLDVYDNGLKLPEDITLVWPDDNYGYIQRLNTKEEQARSGGSGVYYHASYWGRPHDYLWLSSTHPALIREELMKAFETGADRLWVLNVGDIKPQEYDINLFLDMAYNTRPFNKSSAVYEHLLNWTKAIFGREMGRTLADLEWAYYNLAFERRPEFMGWSQTEPTTKTGYTAYNHFYYGDEAQRRIDRYDSLEALVKKLRNQLPASSQDAFYQLVYYPVVGAAWMNKKFLYRDKAYLYAKQSRLSARDYAALSQACYDSIVQETQYYNNHLAGGKWKNIMSMKPRELPVYLAPVLPDTRIEGGRLWNVAPEGSDTAVASARSLQLPLFHAVCPQRFFVDLYLSDSASVRWKAIPSANWITLSAQGGTLSPVAGKNQVRLWVTIDWKKAPKAGLLKETIQIAGGGKEAVVNVSADPAVPAVLSTFKGFVESGGYVSMYAQHFTKSESRGSSKWNPVEGLGHTGMSLMAEVKQEGAVMHATDTAVIRRDAAFVAYDFYNFSEVPAQLSVYTLPTHPLNKNFRMRYAVQVDDGPVQVIDFRTVGRSEEWKQNVLRNNAIKSVSLPELKSGKHRLTVYAIDPGVVLDRILLTFDGVQRGYSEVPETLNTNASTINNQSAYK